MGKQLWISEYSVNDELMDEHHKQIFLILNRLHEIMEEGFNDKEYLKILNDLKDYAVYHFTAEEHLLEKINYPNVMVQKIQHEIYREKIEGFIKLYLEEQQIMSLKMMSFLREWLIKHILELDMDYKKYL